MDISEFIEQDIIIFLDAAVDKQRTSSPAAKPSVDSTIFLNRDYEKDFFAALERQDFFEAKKIMERLKKEFDECPPGTPDKAQLKSLLLALYEKFKEEVDARQAFEKDQKSMVKPEPKVEPKPEIKPEPPKPEIKPEPPKPEIKIELQKPETKAIPKPEARPEKAKTKADPVLIVIEEPHKEQVTEEKPIVKDEKLLVKEKEEKTAQDLFKELEQLGPKKAPQAEFPILNILLDAAEKAAKSGDLKTAIYNYRESKSQAQQNKELPAGLIDRYRAVYASIKMAMADKKTAQADWTSVPVPSSADDMDRQLLLQLEREKRKLDQALHHSDFNVSMQQYKKMEMLANQIHNPVKAKNTSEKLQRIQTIINEIRQHGSNDEHKLMAVP